MKAKLYRDRENPERSTWVLNDETNDDAYMGHVTAQAAYGKFLHEKWTADQTYFELFCSDKYGKSLVDAMNRHNSVEKALEVMGVDGTWLAGHATE